MQECIERVTLLEDLVTTVDRDLHARSSRVLNPLNKSLGIDNAR